MKRIINFFKKIFKVHSPSEASYVNGKSAAKLARISIAHTLLEEAFDNKKATKADLRLAIASAKYELLQVMQDGESVV